MRQIVFPLLFLALAAQSQVQTHGVPASVTSPGTDGQLHGVPSSVTSPTPIGVRSIGVDRSRVLLGNPTRHHRRSEVIPVPVFYPVYVNSVSSEPAQAEPAPDQADLDAAQGAGADALREAYARGAQDALSEIRSRRSSAVSDKSTDKSAEKQKTRVKEDAKSGGEAGEARSTTEEAAQPEPPAQPTIFVFRDGHRLETQNYAIVGQTLFDFSAKPLRKIKIAELDLDATRKVNDEIGSPVTLP